MNAEILSAAGIDYHAGVERFLGDAALYREVLEAFTNDNLLERAKAAYESGDRAQLLRVVHEAKGSSGNADLTRVYGAASRLVQLLRGEGYSDAALDGEFRCFESAYATALDGIRAALSEGSK